MTKKWYCNRLNCTFESYSLWATWKHILTKGHLVEVLNDIEDYDL